MKWATKVDSVGRDHEKDNKESRSILIQGIGVNQNSKSSTKYSENKSEVTTRIRATNEPFEKLNGNPIKVMALLQGNSDNIEQLKGDLANLKKDMQRKFDDVQTLRENMDELKEKVLEEDKTSLVHELKNCIKSNRSIEKDISAIKVKLYKVYGKNF